MFDQLFSSLFQKLVEPADSSNLTIDYGDAESVLFAASILDQHGEWDRARELYTYALKGWPDEHGDYACNSIRQLDEKVALSEGRNDNARR